MLEKTDLLMQSEVNGDGDPIVLVPGGLTGWLSWKPHAEELAKNHKVIRVQLLAVELGLKNEPLPAGYSVDLETQALAKTLDDLGLEKFDLVGWSFGAEISLNYALNYPNKIKTLTLIEPPAFWVLRSQGPITKALEEEQEITKTLGPGPISEDQLTWFTHFAGFVPKEVDPRSVPQWPVWVQHRQSLRTQDVAARHKDSIDRVRKFDKPVLLFTGVGTSEFLAQIIDILNREFPKVEKHQLPGGHAPQLAAKEDFLKILSNFLAKNS